jgi:GNAT superfamily N-acetyltransferase
VFYVDERMPEVSIGVGEDARGQGIGEALLRSPIEEAERRGVGVCLNVRGSNPALRLYERVGFRLAPGRRCPAADDGERLREPALGGAVSGHHARCPRPPPDDVGHAAPPCRRPARRRTCRGGR